MYRVEGEFVSFISDLRQERSTRVRRRADLERSTLDANAFERGSGPDVEVQDLYLR